MKPQTLEEYSFEQIEKPTHNRRPNKPFLSANKNSILFNNAVKTLLGYQPQSATIFYDKKHDALAFRFFSDKDPDSYHIPPLRFMICCKIFLSEEKQIRNRYFYHKKINGLYVFTKQS